MSLRPQPTRWFELLVMRSELSAAIDLLARSARVELQSHGEAPGPLSLPECREMLEEFDALEQRYGHYWPTPRAHVPVERSEPYDMLEGAMMRLRRWALYARDPVERLEDLDRQREDLRLLKALFRDDASRLPNMKALSQAGPMLKVCLYRLATDEWPQVVPETVITHRLSRPDHVFLLAVGLAEEIAALERQLETQQARPVHLPVDLADLNGSAETAIGERIRETTARIEESRRELQTIHEQHDVADAIADVQFVRWYVENVPELSSTEHFAWITGWTIDRDEQSLLNLLADADIRGLLRVSAPPPGFEPPLILENPKWMRPFELFTGMLGVPAAGEADPTRIVAIVSPLMFGYMFGDVGHGVVVLLVGLILSRRLPALRLLVAGGAVSIVFGFLFGSVFTLEGVIEPLWLHPMERPIPIILIPLAGGAGLLLVGMFLEALQAGWQHHGRSWWQTGAGLMLCYVALLGAVWERWLLLVALLGACWFIIGHGFVATRRRLSAAGLAAVEFIEILVQLGVNTISFVRVGAFALAHSGLSMAVVGVSEAPASLPGRLLVLIVGNILIIGLEGLVVGIQTTRLVLFEFFVRFLRAEGRPFRPLAPAPPVPPEEHRRPS